MRLILLSLIFLSFSKAYTQYPKILVQLKDKAGTNFSISQPSQFLSPRAIHRRTRYNIAIDSADLPVSVAYLDSIRSAGKVTVLNKSKWLNIVLIETTDAAAIKKISAFPFVVSTQGISSRSVQPSAKPKTEPDRIVELSLRNRGFGTLDNSYNYGNSYNQLHMHQGEFLHNKGLNGAGMHVAVMDAGFLNYKTITVFDSLRRSGRILGERDFVTFDNSVNEDDSHGTECLSIMAANSPGRMVGSAPQANYWLLRTEKAATEFPVEEFNWVTGAEFADSAGTDIISSSLGYYDFDDHSFDHSYADFYKNATMISKGATIAVRKGMIVVNSAGNEGNRSWKYISFPADADSVCSVGAVNAAGTIAGFSSYGYPGKVKPNIVSLGQGAAIATAGNQIASGNGTSYSAPNIAGLIASLWQGFPAFNNMKILEAVYKSADRYNNPNDRYGFGIPDFKTAFKFLKAEQNKSLYGNEWLFVTPATFIDSLNVKLIGRVDGTVKLELLDESGKIITTNSIVTETEEIYNHTFSNLTLLPMGVYTIRYSDNNNTTRSITIQKGNSNGQEWITAAPNPFASELKIYLKAPQTGGISLKLVDNAGHLIKSQSLQVTENEQRTIIFRNTGGLQRGSYYLQYSDGNREKTLKVLKG